MVQQADCRETAAPDAFLGVPKGGAVLLVGGGLAGGGVPAKPVGADRPAAVAAASAMGATGAPPIWASMGEPPGRAAAAALADGPYTQESPVSHTP
jgi:hypothetical protein